MARQCEIAADLGADIGAIEERIHCGAAFAALAADYQDADKMPSGHDAAGKDKIRAPPRRSSIVFKRLTAMTARVHGQKCPKR
jgi:hypothetical protein